MVSIAWCDDYSVQINSIDNEHKLLIGLIQELDSALKTQEMVRSQLVPSILEKLKRYIHVHFESEECFMQLHDYPELESHQGEHQRLVQKLEQFVSYVNSNKLVFNDPMLSFLKDWLIRHILLEDSKFGKYFRQLHK